MKRLSTVLIGPLAARAGTFIGGAIASFGTFDPALTSRVEAWVTAGAFIAVDLIVAAIRNREAR